jgi:carbon storage regulator
MLVLTRKLEESIVISDDIVITILSIDRDKVKIGIAAPRDVPVMRKELYQAVQEQNLIVEKMSQSNENGHFESLRSLLADEATTDTAAEPSPDTK